ncbi:MAG: TauD/TfdA family dioxygenase [Burkholderiaceae bacterium]|nr:TauD/TfdA family dioxygenase [Burkholderiaceae bacterium]
MSIEVRPLSHALAAEVRGIDLAKPVSDKDLADIQAAWLRHLVLIFPGQKFSEERQIAFGRLFGQLDDHRAVPFYRIPEYPEIYQITNKHIGGKESQTKDTGRLWHSDHSFSLHPSLATMLYCREIPPVGGTTMFANMYMAYDSLSDKYKQMIDGLEAVHDLSHYLGINPYVRSRDQEQIAKIKALNPPVAQPIVRVHPETGKKALFVSEGQTTHIVGMSHAESRTILDHLFKISVTPEFTYRHNWTVDDMLMWDNRCTLHLALADYSHKDTRHMHRITVLGEACGRPLTAEELAAA